MGLIKRVYKDKETIITADNLNDIQDAVIALEDGLFSVDNDKSGEVITITDAANRALRSLSIFGRTTQDGTPTPDNPVDLVSVGGGGSITVNVTGENEANSMTIATPNGLPGIPVADGGNYTDENGQQWICDEIDFARGVYVQRINLLILNGAEEWLEYKYDTQYYGFFVVDLLESGQNRTFGLCNQFSVARLIDGSVWIGVSGNTALYVITREWYDKGINAWKSHLGTNPLHIMYPLSMSIETPLTEEELTAYAALRTYKDNTTVSNDASAHMELEYVMDAKKYIESILGGGSSSARLGSVTIRSSAWVTKADGLHSQVVTIAGVTPYSKVDLLPSVEQLAVFHNKDVAFVTENEDGIVTVFAIGDKPIMDYTMQVSITEVVV